MAAQRAGPHPLQRREDRHGCDYYYNDQWRAVEEYKNSETSPDRRYLWGLRNRWDLVKRLRDDTDDLDEERYVLYDAMDPVAICDETGAVKLRFEYSPFGEVTFLDQDFVPIEGPSGSSSSSSSSEETPETWNWLFHGEVRDEDTGYYNYGNRFYNEATGRWISKDPVGENGGLNLYGFLENEGLRFIDAFGSEKIEGVEESNTYSLDGKTVHEPTNNPGLCGEAYFNLNWEVSASNGRAKGIIVQKVTWTWQIKNCDGVVIDPIEFNGNASTSPVTYYEAWEVSGKTRVAPKTRVSASIRAVYRRTFVQDSSCSSQTLPRVGPA